MMAIAIRGMPLEAPIPAEESWVEAFLSDEEVVPDFLIRPNIPCAGTGQKSEVADDRLDDGGLKSSAGTLVRSGVPFNRERKHAQIRHRARHSEDRGRNSRT